MTRIQILIVVAIAAVVVAIAGPRAVKLSRISRAESDVLAIAKGFSRYRADTGQECRGLQYLLEDPGVPGWLGPYADEETVQNNPWGGVYGADLERQKVVIPKGDPAPDEYELNGSEEISFSFAKEMNLQ